MQQVILPPFSHMTPVCPVILLRKTIQYINWWHESNTPYYPVVCTHVAFLVETEWSKALDEQEYDQKLLWC